MKIAELFAEAIRKGFSDPKEVRRDLSTILASLRDNPESDINELLVNIRTLLASNTDALTLLGEIESVSISPEAKIFGPVKAESNAAVERLALLVKVLFSPLAQFREKVVEFVDQSNTNSEESILNVFNLAKQVNDLLDLSVDSEAWRREVIPALLQTTLKNPQLLLKLTVSATGGALPNEWKPIKDWIQLWDSSRNKSPGDNQDGFFEPLISDYQPAVFHPLEISILRTSILDESPETIKTFSNWLITNVFNRGSRLPNVLPESVFATGSFILAMAQADLLEDSNAAVNEVFETIVINSEDTDETPESWQGKRKRIHEILNACPDWYEELTLNKLREIAAGHLTGQFNDLRTNISAQNNNIPDQFFPAAESVFNTPLQDFRPDRPILEALNASESEFDDPQWKDYLERLQETGNHVDSVFGNETTVRDISQIAQEQRDSFQKILVSPLAEPAFTNLFFGRTFEESVFNTYCQKIASELFLENKISIDGEVNFESLDNQRAWQEIVNKTASDPDNTLKEWANLESWDGLRGRLAKVDIENSLTKRLYQYTNTILSTPQINTVDLEEFRPRLAALAFLGIKYDSAPFIQLISELQTWVVSDSIDPDRKCLLAAARLELGLTAISADVSPSIAFPQFGEDESSLRQLADFITIAIESPNIWESRTGFNVLILSARMAEETGDIRIHSVLATAISNSVKAKELVNESLNTLFTGTGIDSRSGLPLALAAFDLLRYSREAASSIGITEIPQWLSSGENPLDRIDSIAQRFADDSRQALRSFAAEGGFAVKVLLLAVFQIKRDALQLQRQLIVTPIYQDEKAKKIIEDLQGLLTTIRSVFCSEELVLRGFSGQLNEEITPWWQAQYWSKLSVQNSQNSNQLLEDINLDLSQVEQLDQETLSSDLRTSLNRQIRSSTFLLAEEKTDLTPQALVRILTREKQWLILDTEQAYVIEKSDEDSTFLSVAKVKTPFKLFNWASAYYNDLENNLLSLAATLESSFPIISEQDIQDIDGKYEGEFPDLSWKAARELLQSQIARLEEAEERYKEAVESQREDIEASEIVELLEQPLLLNTADYRERIEGAIADLRQAEAELEVAEKESLAAEFETFASALLYDAAELEFERQKVLEEISELDEQIAEFTRQAEEIRKEQADRGVEIAEDNIKLAKIAIEKAKLQKEKAVRARTAILQEIALLKKLLGTNPPPPVAQQIPVRLSNGTEVRANGQIAAMAIKIEDSLMTQLRADLNEAEQNLAVERAKERARKRKAKRRRLIKAACRFIGAIVGGILGGPAGVKLGAEIGAAVGELTNGIIENRPPEDILVGLIDNGFAIAQAAGVDLAKELNSLGAKTSEQIGQFLTQIESSIEPILDSLPNVLDGQIFKDAIEILDLEEVPQLAELLSTSYDDLKSDLNNLGNLGSELKAIFTEGNSREAIGFGNSRDLLEKLTDRLFENTKDNIEQIEALGQAIGEEIEDIRTNPDRQLEIAKAVAEKYGKLLFAQIGQEAGEYQRQILATWIHVKRDSNATWDAIREEGERLVQELFSDSEMQSEVLSNMELSFLSPDILQGKIQLALAPWQAELDKRLNEITRIDEGLPAPRSAVQAAEQRVNYLKKCIEQFENKLLPWLKGENNLQRNQLLIDLDEKLKADLDAIADVEIADLNLDVGDINLAQSKRLLIQAEDEVKRIGKYYQIAEIRVARASLMSRVVNLAKLRAEKLTEAQSNSLKAAEERFKASQARIKAARFNIESRQANLEAATLRGAESSRIRGTLSQPSLRLPKLEDSILTNSRLTHAESLARALKAYRELLRYGQAAKVELPSLGFDETTAISGSQRLKDWFDRLEETFVYSVPLGSADLIEWDLTPLQIQSLFSPSGFKVVLGLQEQESSIIFEFSRDLEYYIENRILYTEILSLDISSSETLLSGLAPGEVSEEWQETLQNQRRIILQDGAVFEKDQLTEINENIGREINQDIWHIVEDSASKTFTIIPDGDRLLIYSRSLLLQEFDKYGITLSPRVTIELDEGGPNWKITDFEEDLIPINSSRKIWNIKGEPISYTLEPLDDRWLVKRRQNPPELYRSAYRDRFYEEIDINPAQTGRMLGIFLSAKERGSEDSWIRRNDYRIEVQHLGDHWFLPRNLQLRKGKLMNTENESRLFWIEDNEEPENEFLVRYNTINLEGDPNPYNSQGIPLSGTTVIKLFPSGEKEFNELKLRLLYKFLSS